MYLIPLISALANAVLTGIVLRQHPRTRLARAFSFLTANLVVWNLNFVVLYGISDAGTALALTRIVRIGSFYVPPAILALILAFRERHRIWPHVLRIDYTIATGLALINIAGHYVSTLQKTEWGFYSERTPFYHIFSISLLLNFITAATILIHDYYSSADPRIRHQLKFWMLGAAIALPLGLTNLLPSYGVSFYPLGNLGNAVWTAIIAYALLQHRLIGIDIAVVKGITYVLAFIVIVLPAIAVTLFLETRFFGRIDVDYTLLQIAVITFAGIAFPIVRLRTEPRVEQSLFKDRYEHRSALLSFSKAIIRFLDQDTLLSQLASRLTDCFNLDRLAILLIDDSPHVLSLKAKAGIAPLDDELALDSALPAIASQRRQSILVHELEAITGSPVESRAAQVLRRNSWVVCVPLLGSTGLMGLLCLGQKRDLDSYSLTDLELLETLAAEAAVALDNARLYAEVKSSREILRRTDRLSALGVLAAGIAHEIRNPLVSIQTFFQLAPQRLDDKEFIESFLPIAAGEVTRIGGLIAELLSFARSPEPKFQNVFVDELVDQVLVLLEPEAKKAQAKLEHRRAPQPRSAWIDPDQIKQVIINLVLNAIHASPAGGSVSVIVRPVDKENQRLVRVEVCDQGPGIPPEQAESVFVPFFTTKARGTGLGLSIAHQIVAEHGGTIRLENNLAGGTRFIVDVPAEMPPPKESKQKFELTSSSE